MAEAVSKPGAFEDIPEIIRPGEELDLARLEPYLRSHFPGLPGPLVVRQFPSGHSNLTYSVTLGEKEMVLRRPPFGSKVKTAHDMGREFRVLDKLHAHYPAPKPLLHCTDESVMGAPFYVMERVHGVVVRQQLPPGLDFSPPVARRLSESFIDNLAALHSLDYNALGLGDLGKPQGYMERQMRGWTERYYGSKTHELPEVETITAWLTQHMPPQGGASLIHNDYKYDNMLLDAADITKIVAVLDWEMCTLGDPLSDLATALGYWVQADDPADLRPARWGPTSAPGTLTRRELADRYQKKTGRDLSDIVFYYVFALFKTAVIIQQIYYRYHHGMTRDERFADMSQVVRMLLQVSLEAIKSNEI
jgi:aminoglycoside phosphotransferase (APT) family kinase protein